ncbi:hypothetical protein ACJX0J_013823, partial [Zea mays]
HKRIMFLLKSKIAPVYIFMPKEEDLLKMNRVFGKRQLSRNTSMEKDLYNIKRPLCTIDPELYENCDDKFILVKDAREKLAIVLKKMAK